MKPKETPDDITECETEREKRRNYYHRNKEKILRQQKEWQEKNPNYFKNWYQDNKEWQAAKQKLREVCRPDKLYQRRLEEYYPGLDASEVEFEKDVAEQCDKIYRRMLKRLRELYNRDPETGRKLD